MAMTERNYKDTLFRMLFNEKKELLALYNALNGTNYDNPEDLEINTLENVIWMNLKNDISFIFAFQMHLYEHQSTYNPNIPLRDLFYIARIYEKVVVEKTLYSTALVKIPTLRFMVFYNGTKEQPEQMKLQQAVERAVEESITEGILAEFLTRSKAEVVQMSIFEYDEEKEIEKIRKAEYEAGVEEGIASGRTSGKAEERVSVIRRSVAKEMKVEVIADQLGVEEWYVKQVVDLIRENQEDTDEQIAIKQGINKV